MTSQNLGSIHNKGFALSFPRCAQGGTDIRAGPKGLRLLCRYLAGCQKCVDRGLWDNIIFRIPEKKGQHQSHNK
ncbi:hypothetical protein DHC50_14475 [Arenibacter sp. A80]|nr:hypothetical protein [Arenibacter sp. A80]RFT55227.1 hypothetical protein D0S24_14470 [Arenibacter sp. P308M17]